uniref:Uncharacterized protein n=1 Tax=Aplanochytrium stocchinoi TaxID=215587 RepID=A0A7S3PLG8_9STRA|mmetsp:Transcript_11241/g.14042  ORF Transcript_11241/g.14042 Transcript_11241/m.14042 type:complete len:136 (+) Transcript_11241:105-512(+)
MEILQQEPERRFVNFWHHLRLKNQNLHPFRKFYSKSPILAEIILISTVTFIFFSGEALIHYNIGKGGGLGSEKFSFPQGEELALLLGTMIGFSAASTITISLLKHCFGLHPVHIPSGLQHLLPENAEEHLQRQNV